MIVVTGTGIVSAIGTNTPEVARALLADTSGIAPVRFLETQHRQMPVGEVKLSNEQLAQRLGVPCTANTSRTMLLGTLALREALAMAGINSEQLADVALVSGTTVADMDCVERHFNAGQSNNALGDCGRSTQEIVQNVGPFGYVTTCSTACSSAANAFILGANLLRSGRFKQVVVGGTECLSRFHFNGFRSLMILDGEPCRPFDDTRAGLNLGEGAAFVVLETAEHAAQRGVEVLAELSGWGNACDAFHQTASPDDGIGAVLSMRQALKRAALQPADIDYVNAHGTGTPIPPVHLAASRPLFAYWPCAKALSPATSIGSMLWPMASFPWRKRCTNSTCGMCFATRLALAETTHRSCFRHHLQATRHCKRRHYAPYM